MSDDNFEKCHAGGGRHPVLFMPGFTLKGTVARFRGNDKEKWE
jgi:hypothetical protein